MEARFGRRRSVATQALCEHRLATSRAATNLVKSFRHDLNLFGFNDLVLSVRRDALADLWVCFKHFVQILLLQHEQIAIDVRTIKIAQQIREV